MPELVKSVSPKIVDSSNKPAINKARLSIQNASGLDVTTDSDEGFKSSSVSKLLISTNNLSTTINTINIQDSNENLKNLIFRKLSARDKKGAERALTKI